MKLRQLEYFVRILDSGSVSRASQSLHVAQPALSQQISQLEEELGVKLMTRTVRGVDATEAGLAVYRQAQLILRQVEATRLIAQEAELGPAGTVTIGLPWTVASLLGLSLLAEVGQSLKAVRLEIIEGPSSVLASSLAEGKIEIAVVFDSVATAGIAMRPILTEALYFIGPRDALGGLTTMALADIADFPLLLLSRPNGIRELIEIRLATAGLRPRVAAEINAPSLLHDAVKAGLGFAVLPACGLEEARRAGMVDAVPLDDGALQRTVFIGTSRLFALSLAGEHVRDILQRLMRDAVTEQRWSARLLA